MLIKGINKEKEKELKMEYRVVVTLAFVVFMAKEAIAAQHTVGGSQGWDESADFKSWASAQKFKVGDQLVFKYTPGLHSVVELASETAYKNCDLGSALDSTNAGNDVVKLNKPGTRYFACGTLGHCDQGMKVKITTVSGTAPSTPASSSTTASSSSGTSLKISAFATFVLLIAKSLIHAL